MSPRVAADDPAAHWLLARVNVDRARHAVALHRLAADSAPLAASLDLDLAARQALARRDSTQALRLWDWRPGIPLSLAGDSPQVLTQIRAVLDNDWYGTNAHVGAPFGMTRTPISSVTGPLVSLAPAVGHAASAAMSMAP